MGNAPSEAKMGERLKCCKCQQVLPPCKSFDNLRQGTVHGRRVHIFNGGEYYRPVGQDMAYECERCFNWLAVARRLGVLDQRLEESCRQAREQQEQEQDVTEEQETKQEVTVGYLNQLQSHPDDLLKILSVKCSVPIANLRLSHLRGQQLRSVLSALDTLLFDEWIAGPPSLSTLQHTQVLLTELCALSLDEPEGASLSDMSNQLQSLLESISQSALSASASLLLSQALYLSLMLCSAGQDRSPSDAALIAKRWAEQGPSEESLLILQFLSSLMASLRSASEKASVPLSSMEVRCLELLLAHLRHLSGGECHSEPTGMLVRLVLSSRWSPEEAVMLLRALADAYSEYPPITELLRLVQVYQVPAQWRDDCGQSLTASLKRLGSEQFLVQFRDTLKDKDQASLDSALAELKTFRVDVDESDVGTIKNISTAVLQYSRNAPEAEWLTKDSFKGANMNAEDIQSALCQLCKAVHDTRGWWPTARQVSRCALVLLEQKSGALQLLVVEQEPCVTAMLAAAQVCMGHKLDIVTNSDSHRQVTEWAGFYQHLGISLSTNQTKNQRNVPQRDVYEADIVYGTLEDFVTDYFQFALEAKDLDAPPLSRGFLIQERSLSGSQNMELPRLKENDAMTFAAECLQSLMGHFQTEDVKLRHKFFKCLFQVLHSNLNEATGEAGEVLTILLNCSGNRLSPTEDYILIFFENLLRVFTGETGRECSGTILAGKVCLEILFACAVQFQGPKARTKELLQMTLNLVTAQRTSAIEALSLLTGLTQRHQDEGCISIMKILHLMETYQVSSEWMDDNSQSLLQLFSTCETQNLIQHLEMAFKDEKIKSLDCLFAEIHQMKDMDEETLEKVYSVVKPVRVLIESGDIAKHTDVQQARRLSRSTDTEELQEILAVLCNTVHVHVAKGCWWPRDTQMISWCLLALADKGRLLEMGTGEGKSCVISMFAALRALRGERVDVVSSSSVLCQRDAEEWSDFYSHLGLTVDANTKKNDDEERKQCYQKDIVYGTIAAFAADHLRQNFQMKDVRPDRSYQCVIIDEVDSLLLDQGVQLTYLSSPSASMQHLNTILAMIWSHVSQYGFLSTAHQTFVQGPPASFFKAIFDSVDTEGTEIQDAMDILSIAEESNIVPHGFTEDIYQSGKDAILTKLKTVSQDKIVDFFQEMEKYVPYDFILYTLDDSGLLSLRKPSTYDNPDILELSFLVLADGLCCPLYDSQEMLIGPIAELIADKIQYTPCENTPGKISIPGFLRTLVEAKTSVWVQNAFLAVTLKRGREYVVEEESVCPVEYRSTGVVERNKKWGDGLQQFLEMRHQVKLSIMSTVTNYISNVAFFEKYDGKIYGTTGTLGTETDLMWLRDLYPNLSACSMPTFNRRKLFEVEGTLKTSPEEWRSEIQRVVMSQICPNAYRDGRAALVICESINSAKEIHEGLRNIVPGEIILYCRSDTDSLSRIDRRLLPGDVIVATNLAGRGTNIQVSDEVNKSGGLFVLLTFLPENNRVELQAFGRTARKGKPGSAQIVMTTTRMPTSYGMVKSLGEAKKTRQKLAEQKLIEMRYDITEMKLREDLFAQYCKTLRGIYRDTEGDEEGAVVSIMNEFWGIWLQTKEEDIDQLRRSELENSLSADLARAERQCHSQTSPCASIYHYIYFANVAVMDKKWDVSIKLFEKAMEKDESWAAIAFYSHAYCTLHQQKDGYLSKAIEDLQKAQTSLNYLSEECMVCLQFIKMAASTGTEEQSRLEKQFSSRCSMLSCFEKNIREAMAQLQEIQKTGRDAVPQKSPIFSLLSDADEGLQEEASNLYSRGLKYVFTVEQEARFPWEALLVFCLGVLQVLGGALLTAFTFGTLAQVGVGLIVEGVSDLITGVESMVTGKFSWQAWAVEKAVSIGVSLISFGVGKLVTKGYKAAKLMTGAVKQLTSVPKALSSQVKGALSVAMKTNMKNAIKHTAKSMVENIVMYTFGKAEKALLNEILAGVKKEVRNGILSDVTSKMEKEPLASSVDSVILSHLVDKSQLSHLLQDQDRKSKFLDLFKTFTNNALQPFYEDLTWQNKLNSSLCSVLEEVKGEASGRSLALLTAIQTVHMSTLAADALSTVLGLSDTFFANFEKELKDFQEENRLSQEVSKSELSASEINKLDELKQDLTTTMSTLLAGALVEVFQQKFSSHFISHVQGKVNNIINQQVRTGLKSDRTDEALRAGQKRCAENMQKKSAGLSQSHADKIMDPKTEGTIIDIKVLSETTNTRVVILTEGRDGTLSRMQELKPSSDRAAQTVTLIYRPKSTQNPDGHYDVRIDDRIVSIDGGSQGSLHRALARGMRPEAGPEAVALEAERLRSAEAEALRSDTGQWERLFQRQELVAATRGHASKGHKLLLRQEAAKVRLWNNWMKING